MLPESCTLLGTLDVSLPSASGYVYEGTLDGSKVRVQRVRLCPEGDPRKVKEVHSQRLMFPFFGTNETQTFHQVIVTWKHLTHPNIVPFLGVTTDPPQLISDWMSGGDLPAYITNNPYTDRLCLVGVLSIPLCDVLTLSSAI